MSAAKKKMTEVLIRFYYIPEMIMIVFIAVVSLFRTTYFELYQSVEVPYDKNGHPVIVFLFSAALFWILCLRRQRGISLLGEGRKIQNWNLVAGGLISLFFVMVFRGTATADSLGLSHQAAAFLAGNGGDLQKGGYLSIYPFQLGAVAVIQLIWFLFGNYNYTAFQILNVAAIIGILHLLDRITAELFEEDSVKEYGKILSVGMLPLFLYATFLYGDIIGLALGTMAIYLEIVFLKTEKCRKLIWAGVFISLAICVKSNHYVILAAMVILLVLKWIRSEKQGFRRRLCWGLGILTMILLPQILVMSLGMVYCGVFGMEKMPAGAPKILWVAMSLQEDAPFEYGWYNGYNRNTYVDSGFDQEASKDAAIESITVSLQNFLSRPGYTARFFYRKFVSQWNAPCFQGLITNEWSSRHSENLSGLADFLLHGMGRSLMGQWMNFYHFIVYLCASCFFIKKMRNISLAQALLPLCIFGGMVFHLLWEAQSRYALPYFVLTLPLAAKGMEEIVSLIRSLRKTQR